MTFRENANIGAGRASRGGGGGGGLAVGGGIGALLLALVVMLFGGDPGAVLGGGQQAPSSAENVDLAECQSGADANENRDCRVKGAMLSLERYWTQTYDKAPPTQAIIFSGAVNTQCGQASSQVGPFYCPLDETIYLDTSFFDQLKGQLGAEGGALGEMYVIGHEYGHHIQNYTGALRASQQDRQGPESGAVRVELQADCFAGAWLANASGTTDTEGDDPLLEPPTEEQVRTALSAASAVGDDSIQERMQGEVTPHTWTHGSSEQRMGWFMRGYSSGDAGQCDVMNADSVDSY
jgi:uncharacterized protein